MTVRIGRTEKVIKECRNKNEDCQRKAYSKKADERKELSSFQHCYGYLKIIFQHGSMMIYALTITGDDEMNDRWFRHVD